MTQEPATESISSHLPEYYSGRSLIEDFDAGTDIASALGKFITRLHEPSRSLVGGYPTIRLEEDGLHLIIPWYDGGFGDRLEVSVESNGRRVECGRLEGVPLGGCLVTKPKSISMTAYGIDPFSEFRILVDGSEVSFNYGLRRIYLNGSLVATTDLDSAEYVAIPSYSSIWLRSGSCVTVHSRLPGVTVMAFNGSPSSDFLSFDLTRRWPKVKRVPGTISFLPEVKESTRRWESAQWIRDPTGRTEKTRARIFYRNLPESCMLPHTPRFGFVVGTVSLMLLSEGPYIRIPPLEYIQGPEPPITIKQGDKEFTLPQAGTTGCGGYRVRIKQILPVTEIGFNPIRHYTICSGDEVLYEHHEEKALYFTRDGTRTSTPAGECFVLTDTSSGWKVSDARYLESAVMWKFGISRIFVPADISREKIASGRASFYEVEHGEEDADIAIPDYIEEEGEAPVEEAPKPVVRPKRLKVGQVLEDGAVVCSPVEERGIRSLSLDDMRQESDAAIRKRILRSIMKHTGDWVSDPHLPAYRFVGPPPRLTMSSFEFIIRMSCYECSENDRMLVEVTQGDSTRVLYPLPPSIDVGGCRIMDDYEISVRHLGLDPFGGFVIGIDGRKVLSFPAKDILLFSTDGGLIERSDRECIACHRTGHALSIDGRIVDQGIVEGDIVFTSIKGRFDTAELVEAPEIPEPEVPATIDDVTESSDAAVTESEDDLVSFVCHDDCPNFDIFSEPKAVDYETVREPVPPAPEPHEEAEEPVPSTIEEEPASNLGSEEGSSPVDAEIEETSVSEPHAPSEDTEHVMAPVPKPVPEIFDPMRAEREALLAKASALYERQVDLRNRDISELSFDDIFGDDDENLIGGGREFLGSGPALFFSGTRVHLFIPPYCGLYGDRFQLEIGCGGRRVDLGRMGVRANEPLVTQKKLIDLVEEGVHPLERFDVRIDGNTVFRGRFFDFLFFDAEGRHLMSPDGSYYVMFNKDCRIEGSGIRFDEAYLEDGTGLMTILASSEDSWFRVIHSRTSGNLSRIAILPDRGFIGKTPSLRFNGKVFELTIQPYRCHDDDPCILSFETGGRRVEYGPLKTYISRRAASTFQEVVDLDALGIDVLDGFTASIDDAVVYSLDPADRIFFSSGGPVTEPSGDIWMAYRRGLEPSGTGCEVRSILNYGEDYLVRVEIAPGGTLSASGSGCDPLLSGAVHYEPASPCTVMSAEEVEAVAEPPEPRYIRQLRSKQKVPDPDVHQPVSDQSSEKVEEKVEEPVPEPTVPEYRPDSDVTEEELIAMLETNPVEECEPVVHPDYVTGYGFFDCSPRLFIIRDRPILVVPPYSGSSEDPFHASVESSAGIRDLGVLPRESGFSAAFTFIDLSDVDIPGGFRLVIDGKVAFEYPASRCSVFSGNGVRTDLLDGDVTILLDGTTAIQGSGFQYDGREVPGGYLAHASIGEDSFVRVGDARRTDGKHIDLWPDRTLVDHRPSIRYAESGPALRIPDYRCLEGDPCRVELRTDKGTIVLGEMDSHPGLGAAVATGRDFDLESRGVNVLDGFTVSIDGNEIFRSAPSDHMLFTYSGFLSEVPRGDVTMIHRPDLVPFGKDYRITDEQDRVGYRVVKARVGTNGHLSVGVTRAPEFMEEQPEEAPTQDEAPGEIPEEVPEQVEVQPVSGLETVRLGLQAGFVHGTPFLEYRNGIFQIYVPAYRGLPWSEMECWLAQSGSRTRPFKLTYVEEDGCRTSRPVLIVIPKTFDPLAQFGVYIDGARVHGEPDRRIMFFPGGGGRMMVGGKGPLVAVYHPDEEIVNRDAEVEWTRDEGAIRISGVRIGPMGFFGPDRPRPERKPRDRILREYSEDDLLRADGLLESEYAEKVEAERRAEEEARKPISIAVPEAGSFRDGGPTLMFDGHGFLVHIPSYAAEEDRMLSVVLFVGGAPVSTVRLEGPVISGVRITEPISFPLSDFEAAPFDEIEVLMDGETVFKKEEDDFVVLDEHYRYKGVLEGKVHVVVRKGMRYKRHRVTEKSRRGVGGATIITMECAHGASMEIIAREGSISRLGFTDEYPSIRYRDGRFFLTIPRYLGRPGDPYETTIQCNKRRIPAPPLPLSPNSNASQPTFVDLTSMGVSPLDDFSLLIDDELVFINRATDRMIFDSEGEQQVSVVGQGFVVVPRGSRTAALGAGTVSSRNIGSVRVMDMDFSDGGVLEVGPYISPNDYARAIRDEDSRSPVDSSVDVRMSFTNDPYDITAYPVENSILGQAYIAQGLPIPSLPFFGRTPGVEVTTIGCDPSDCTIRVEDMEGNLLFGPVQVTAGTIMLDTDRFEGIAQAVVSVNGKAVRVLRYFIVKKLYIKIPESSFYTGDSVAMFKTQTSSYECKMYKGKRQTYRNYSAIIKFNITYYHVSTTVNGIYATHPLQHSSVCLSDLSGKIRVHVRILGDRTPRVRKRILMKSGSRVMPLTKSWIEGNMDVGVDYLKEKMAGEDCELFIEEEGRGTFNFMTVRCLSEEAATEEVQE